MVLSLSVSFWTLLALEVEAVAERELLLLRSMWVVSATIIQLTIAEQEAWDIRHLLLPGLFLPKISTNRWTNSIAGVRLKGFFSFPFLMLSEFGSLARWGSSGLLKNKATGKLRQKKMWQQNRNKSTSHYIKSLYDMMQNKDEYPEFKSFCGEQRILKKDN